MNETPFASDHHQAYVSEVEQWLEDNDARLAEVARRSGTSLNLVHLAAVLVLRGLADRDIHDQFVALEPRLAAEHSPVAQLWRALPDIRALAAQSGWPAVGQTSPSGRPSSPTASGHDQEKEGAHMTKTPKEDAEHHDEGAEKDHPDHHPHLRQPPRSDVCELCGSTEHVHEGLCRHCRQRLLGEGRFVANEKVLPPHQPEPSPPPNPRWRRHGA